MRFIIGASLAAFLCIANARAEEGCNKDIDSGSSGATLTSWGATINEFIFPAGGVRFNAPAGRSGSVWNSPAVFERLAPGSGFSIVLALKRGETPAPRTFTFSAVAP